MNDCTITYIVQEGSANKIITNITTTQNAKSSHTHRRMQTCYHQKKVTSDSPSRTEISSASKVALGLHLSLAAKAFSLSLSLSRGRYGSVSILYVRCSIPCRISLSSLCMAYWSSSLLLVTISTCIRSLLTIVIIVMLLVDDDNITHRSVSLYSYIHDTCTP